MLPSWLLTVKAMNQCALGAVTVPEDCSAELPALLCCCPRARSRKAAVPDSAPISPSPPRGCRDLCHSGDWNEVLLILTWKRGKKNEGKRK